MTVLNETQCCRVPREDTGQREGTKRYLRSEYKDSGQSIQMEKEKERGQTQVPASEHQETQHGLLV